MNHPLLCQNRPTLQCGLCAIVLLQGKVAALIRWGGHSFHLLFPSTFAMLLVKNYSDVCKFVELHRKYFLSLFFSWTHCSVISEQTYSWYHSCFSGSHSISVALSSTIFVYRTVLPLRCHNFQYFKYQNFCCFFSLPLCSSVFVYMCHKVCIWRKPKLMKFL